MRDLSLVALKLVERGPRPGVPETGLAVPAGGQDGFAVGGEGSDKGRPLCT